MRRREHFVTLQAQAQMRQRERYVQPIIITYGKHVWNGKNIQTHWYKGTTQSISQCHHLCIGKTTWAETKTIWATGCLLPYMHRMYTNMLILSINADINGNVHPPKNRRWRLTISLLQTGQRCNRRLHRLHMHACPHGMATTCMHWQHVAKMQEHNQPSYLSWLRQSWPSTQSEQAASCNAECKLQQGIQQRHNQNESADETIQVNTDRCQADTRLSTSWKPSGYLDWPVHADIALGPLQQSSCWVFFIALWINNHLLHITQHQSHLLITALHCWFRVMTRAHVEFPTWASWHNAQETYACAVSG